MVRERIFGTECDFCRWMRGETDLPSSEFVASDVDLLVHAYRSRRDGNLTRQIQCIQIIEVKTRNGEPTVSQRDTLWKVHKGMNQRTYCVGGNDIRNFGVSFVSLSGVRPDESEIIRWGRFKNDGTIRWRTVDADKLKHLMKCEHDPQTLEKRIARLHHSEKITYEFRQCELGFTVAEKNISRS